jgi:hypothetical protein
MQPNCSPKPSHGSSISGFAVQPPRTSRFANAEPHHHHHLNRTTAPHPPIALHRRLTRRTPNRAIALRFVGFGSQGPLLPRVCERRAPLPPTPHPPHPTTTHHRPPPPFDTAHPESSHRAQIRRIRPPAAPRLTFRECGAPPPPPPQPHNHRTSPHRPPPPFDTAHPESSHRAQIRGIWLPGPPPASRLRMQSPTTTTTSSHHHPPSPSTAV